MIFEFLPELYFNPQVYFYNPIFGYYPGVIYDYSIEITSTLIKYRLFNIAFCVLSFIVIIKNMDKSKKLKLIVIALVIASALMLSINKSIFGFATDIGSIKKELKNEINTQHFNILVPESLDSTTLKLIEYEHEYYYHNISSLLKTNLEEKITSFIFETGAQKKKLFGSENADVAKTWANQIYLNQKNNSKTLKHEISHIFSANFASGIFKVPSGFNPGIIEGFAMAVENNYDDFNIDYIAAVAYKNDFKISLDKLFTGFSFFSNVSSLSYIYSGSFFKFLGDRYGWQKITKVYAEGNFTEIFGYGVDELEKEYYKYIDSVIVDENANIAKYYFGRLPLLKRYCARATAKELRSAQTLFSEKKYSKASEKFLKIYNYSNSYQALVGYAYSQKEIGNINESIKILTEEIEKFKNTSSYYYLEFLLADFYAFLDHYEKADYYYSLIINQNPHPNYLSSARFKKQLLNLRDSTLQHYMKDGDFKSALLLDYVQNYPSDEVIQLYLRRQEDGIQNSEEKLRLLKSVTAENLFSSTTYFSISKFAFRNLMLIDALHYAELSLQAAEFKTKSVIEEQIAKIKWIMANHG